MERRDAIKLCAGSAAGLLVTGMAGLDELEAKPRPGKSLKNKERKTLMKKYTNADFYKDGKFQEDVAIRAYFEMFEHFHYSLTDSLRGNKDFWVAEFGAGDFEHVGMGGIFWLNDKENRYFGHEIYLLPGQMIPEHFHLPGEGLPAKHESWQVRNGSIYNFSFGGEKTPEALALLPKSQLDSNAVRCFKFKELKTGGFDRLGKLEEPHFMIGGPEGAIVTEYGTYHSMKGLNFTNKTFKL